MTADVDQWIAALRRSHEHLVEVVEPLAPENLGGPSYASEWSIAQVLSHLGSGAEIFAHLVRAGVDGSPAPGPEQFQPIWAQWNAKGAVEQANDALAADGSLVAQIESLPDAQRRAWTLSFFGTDRSLVDLLRMRLGELAVHTWDIEVMRTPRAGVAGEAAGLLVGGLGEIASRADKSVDQELAVHIATDAPERSFLLRADPSAVTLAEDAANASDEGEATLRLPAEALIRLVYGRLDPEHTPETVSGSADLDVLRRMFPGF